MSNQVAPTTIVRLMFLLPLLALISGSCSGRQSGEPFQETFESAGKWGVGTTADVEGQVNNGVYDMLVKDNHGIYYASAGENFSDGSYTVEATQIDGPLNNGYGLLFRLDEESDTFYAFEVSGDGYIWIGYCSNLCKDDAVALAGGDWFRSAAVNTGLHETNRLRVVAEGQQMTFFVNGQEVARTADSRLIEGDIAVMVEALGESGVRVIFDNLEVSQN